jgi:argininosuccinate lyase
VSASGTGGPWHRAYAERVLAPDQAYAAEHLFPTFLDVLTAHLRTVARLPVAAGHRAAIADLDAALQRQRDEPPPAYREGVPDLYFALQRRLEEEVGEEALAWLRLGLSRNDLDMTVYVMAARTHVLALAQRLGELQEALLRQAEDHLDTVVIARTHHQPAQPSTLAHVLAACAAVIARDHDRVLGVLRRLDRCPLGAAALTGSSHPLDRTWSAAALGFAGPVENTYDAVAASDWQLDLAALAQVSAIGLSRLTHDLLRWAEVGVLRLPDELVQGSSIMPQKRNPIALEHARTRFSRAAGASQQTAFGSHNVPFADLNDSGTDAQEPLHAALTALEAGLDLVIAVLTNGTWNEDVLAADAAASDTTATELADELVRTAGLPFPEAHRVAGTLVREMAAQGRPLQRATPDDLAAAGGPEMEAAKLSDALSPAAFVARRGGIGGPAPASVEAHLTGLRRGLAEYHDVVATATSRVDGALRTLRTPGKDVQS